MTTFNVTSSSIKVLVVDDHDVVRSGLGALVYACEDMELVGEAVNGSEAVDLCAELKPDVVLMDLVMPVMDGVAATRAIRQGHPQTQVIALTSFDDAGLVQGALQAGAISYLLKTVSADELAQTIREASHGRSILSPEAARALSQARAKEN